MGLDERIGGRWSGSLLGNGQPAIEILASGYKRDHANIPLNTQSSREQQVFMLENGDVDCLIFDEENRERAAEIIGFTALFYIQFEGYILPSLFAFRSVDVLVLIMLGGLRTMYGPVLGAAVVLIINEELAGIGQWRTVVFGGLLVILFLYFRERTVLHLSNLRGTSFGFMRKIESILHKD